MTLKKFTIFALLCLVSTGMIFAGVQPKGDSPAGEMKTFTCFFGYPKENYPVDGTILGDWVEEKTGVKIEWEFIVGDLKEKTGLLIASGDYPDLVSCRNENRSLYDAGALIPLKELIEEHGPNIKKLLGDKMAMMEMDDGEIYWLPQYFPYRDKVQATVEAHGLYIQKAVLKEFGWPMPANLEEAVDMLIEYAKKYPEINGHKTMAFTALTYSWREYALLNAPHILSGHPNDGAASVDWVDGKWKATQFYDTKEAYNVYKIYNKIDQAGVWDRECFVMDYDQYLAKLSSGSILAFYDQRWSFDKVRKLMVDQNQDRWWVGLPVVMKGYEEEFEGPLEPQVSEGLGISINCKDPVGAIKYLDFIASEEVQITKNWGFEGVDYFVEPDGSFNRTPEKVLQWKDKKWLDETFGQIYWLNIASYYSKSMFTDGINAVGAENQPAIFYASLTPAEKEVLDAYDKKTWFDFFKKPDMRRAKYFPMWTVKVPTGSDIDIAAQKILEIRRKYTPLLIMAEEGKYDEIWDEYIAELNKVPNKEEHAQFFQDQLDLRVEKAGGY
jgi:putative aldouronate transport system substrate-binding protein